LQILLTKMQVFNPKEVDFNASILFVGPRGCGKTTGMVDLLTKRVFCEGRPVNGTLVCPTVEVNPKWKEKFPPGQTYTTFDEVVVDALRRICTKQTKKGEAVHTTGSSTGPRQKPRILVADDIQYHGDGGKGSFFNCEPIKNILLNGRWLRVLFLVGCQDSRHIPKFLRTQFTWVFLFRNTNLLDQENYWKDFGSTIPKEEFLRLYREVTKLPGSALVIRQLQDKPGNDNRFYRYERAEKEVERFAVGSHKEWEKYSEPIKRFSF